MTKSELEEFNSESKFKKLFVFKEFHKGLVHYFSSRFLKGGPTDGSNPEPIEQPTRSESLGQLKKTKALEERLTALDLEEPRGEDNANWRNESRFIDAILPLLEDSSALG